jgi:MFS family permease
MQGLKNNWKQFWLLVIINAFVGSMIGLERSVIPGLAATLGVNSHTGLLSFIVAFGISKSCFNLITGKLAQSFSRKNILLFGWIAAVPVPFMLMYATSWEWVIAANLLLGINQGLAWSSTVIMKIDLVGEKNRGLAMGINEFAGYLSVGIAAYLASTIAAAKGFLFFPFIPGIFFSIAGLWLTIFFVKDTTVFVHHESKSSKVPMLKNIWNATTYQHPNLGSITINGLVNNLNDGVVWGLLPILLAQKAYSIEEVGLIVSIYPVVWGIGQLFTGKLGDVYNKKHLVTIGMLLQALALIAVSFSKSISLNMSSMILLGIGTALVYPNFLAIIAENTHPAQRAQSMSIFRFWRDGGYVIGALFSGILADSIDIIATLNIVALFTAGAGLYAFFRMR